MAVERVLLSRTTDGTHVLTSDVPVGVAVIGYGLYTSYAYPAGPERVNAHETGDTRILCCDRGDESRSA